MNDSKLKVGTKIILNGKKYEVVADDTSSYPHPSRQFKKWDYILLDLESRRASRYTISELDNIQILPDDS